MALLSALKDPFVGANLNTQLWTAFTGGSATLANGNGMSTIFPATTSSSTDGDISSNVNYDLTGNYAFMQIPSVSPASATSTDNEMRLRIDANNWLRWVKEGGSIFAQYKVAGSTTTVTSFTHNPAVHRWVGIFETGGFVTWSTSVDGLTWTPQGSPVADPIVITSLNVLIAGLSFGVDTAAGIFTWRYFNTPFSEGPYRHLEVGNLSRAEVAN